MKKKFLLLVVAVFLLLQGCHRETKIDPMARARVDALNREAFLSRYKEPERCIEISQQALDYIADSLPQYNDGMLRAQNNMAFALYQKSEYGASMQIVDKIEKSNEDSPNRQIEQVIAQLLKARLLQRNCQIADSYRLLYNIGRSRVLDRNRDNLLYNYAQTEYYITSLVLNFHYRQGKEADVCTLLEEIEANRASLNVDYAQDMALNYALAYGWQTAGESLTALDYCDENMRLLGLPGVFCTYHYANTLQMMASALKSMPGTVSPDSVLALYDDARIAFFDYGDPYQMLGGVTSTARYALLIGDTMYAHEVLSEWLALKGVWKPFSAPKMELGLFDVLIRSRLAEDPDEVKRWYEFYRELQDYISLNEREDFALQEHLASTVRRSIWLTATAVGFGILILMLLVLSLLLWLSLRRLQKEKQYLEAAKRRDVERIANVETALSVLRHDVSPFMGYLRNPELPAEVRDEVLDQLLHTFENIKRWTRLSVPSGLSFNATNFPLQELFDDVKRQAMKSAEVELRFEDTLVDVFGDQLLLTILLRNLISNALQHTEHGSVVVSAVADSETSMVDITVADTGCGMTHEQVESLFRADRQLPEGSEHGFGLILCRYIISKHDDNTRRGCKLWAESTVGEGTTMHCRVAMSNKK